MRLDWQSVPMPASIAARPRDARGFPITFVTLMDDGRPDFTTIDADKIVRCIKEGLCGLCGEGWPSPSNSPSGERRSDDHQVAFIGGPLSCANQNFLDPPMHVECAQYAMQVCPHIVIPTARYAKSKAGVGGREEFAGVHPDRPEKFGLYLTEGYEVASYMGQPVFLANEPIDITWSTDG